MVKIATFAAAAMALFSSGALAQQVSCPATGEFCGYNLNPQSSSVIAQQLADIVQRETGRRPTETQTYDILYTCSGSGAQPHFRFLCPGGNCNPSSGGQPGFCRPAPLPWP